MKSAWMTKDPQAAADLCSQNGFEYFEDVYSLPLTTKDAVKMTWAEVPIDQDNVKFDYAILGELSGINIAHWTSSFWSKKRNQTIEMDGIFHVKLDDAGDCIYFKQWWILKSS